jgi:outer membrane lipoprotein-sorting protein
MKRAIKNFFLVASCVLWLGGIQAQDIEEDLDKMAAAYKDGERLYLEMENTVYKGTEKVKSVSSTLLKSGSNYQYKTDEHQMVLNDKHVIFVDQRNYNLIVSTRNHQQEELQQKAMPLTKEVLKNYQEINYQGISNGYKHYQLKNAKEQVIQIDLFFEVKTGFVKKAIYHYNPNIVPDNMSTIIQLKVINTAPSVSISTFSASNFWTTQNKKLVPIGKYSKYSLYDNRTPKS